MSSRWTTGPSHLQWTAGESNPDCLGANQASSRWTSGPPMEEVRPGVEPGLPPYRGGVLPKHLQTASSQVIPGGVDHRFPGCHPGVFAVGPRDHASDRDRSRTCKVTRLSTSPLFLFAYPGVAGPGVAHRRSRLMRPGWALAHPQLQAPVSSRAYRPYESQLGTCRACNVLK